MFSVSGAYHPAMGEAPAFAHRRFGIRVTELTGISNGVLRQSLDGFLILCAVLHATPIQLDTVGTANHRHGGRRDMKHIADRL